MNGNNFIRCSDKDTIRQLEQLGFKKVSNSNGVAVFINDLSKPQNFSKKGVVYTNIMTMT